MSALKCNPLRLGAADEVDGNEALRAIQERKWMRNISQMHLNTYELKSYLVYDWRKF